MVFSEEDPVDLFLFLHAVGWPRPNKPVVTLGFVRSGMGCFWNVFLVQFCVDFWRRSEVLNLSFWD
ncbi:CAX-interacting protein 4-like [Iris pallida]|uniref:CAX-interacting protein 4-like n=1 Tax=Iris pallida TaxID=29817 RepID=A0AAX6G7D8_IRIPA|nr:CAX-interacting protein 4-like [Iris pallida]KAJ6824666.1 CAX-interacting protein 4-like [Iris pallida]KAJ6838911.1 CAX-interacting protein 4-like [Iris pallida]KAJ6838912.1 CAX-interacting protein 4-like [Iris pallida]KAJ6842368.1 CAX-interacting protein 4-like [Iris pallida]